MPAADPLVGQRIGSIRIEARLGAGAMGVVYRGFHDLLRKPVAVKVLSIARGNDVHARERFLREGRAAAKISHPNVVQVFEAGLHDGAPYLVMELVVGHSLGSLLDEVARKQGGTPTGLPPEAVVRLGTGIALGISAIHAAGVVHRDIKPDNVMVAADRTPKVADLGLAKEISDPELNKLTGTGMVVGTPLYCAPEAIRDPQSIGPAADVYSLGATLYHMLCGQPPFEAATAYEVMRAHLEDRPRPLRDSVAGVPLALAELVEACLDKDPKRRPSALQVAEALGSGIRLKGRPRIGAATIAALCIVAIGGGGGALWWHLRPATASGQAAPATAALILESTRQHLRARVDGGAWQPVRAEGLTVSPGDHRVEVETDLPGPLLRWSGTVHTTPAGLTRQPVEPEAVAIPEVRLAIPGAGMLYCAGVANGLEPAASVTWAGTWPLARWEGRMWRTRTWSVDANGRSTQLSEGSGDRPFGDAWWARLGADGQPADPHHIICWWEAERARTDAGLPEPPGWAEQAIRPAQPALNLNAAMVEAVLSRLGDFRLPERAQAAAHAARLRQAVWHRDARGRPALVGGGTDVATGAVVVVPP